MNYDIPYDNESYVHRIGRTGRAGRDGQAILFVAPKERRLLRSIEQSTRQTLTAMELPTGEQVSGQRIQQFQERIVQSLESKDLERFKTLLEKFAEDNSISMTDIAAGLAVQLQEERPLFPSLAPLDAGQRDSRQRDSKQRDRGRDRGERSPRSERQPRGERAPRGDRPQRGERKQHDDIDMVTYRMEVGKNHGVMPKDIVGAIANEAGIESQNIGRIKLNDDYSTVDLPEGMPKEIFQHLKNKVRVCQQPMKLSILDQNQPKKHASGNTSKSTNKTKPRENSPRSSK